ncbi:S8 family peptidase [Streptomyces sp. NRRL S-87]|uniref:S8 family peptidase n=1 Tax=Streptomyces sp. NRRL S-87 TaxID=1463920 RepID=UPI0004C0AF4D|nr:S8 family peptidase [Streptomyces sp. NRRL S-87]
MIGHRLRAIALLGAALLGAAALPATAQALPPAAPEETGSWIVVLKDGATPAATRSLAAGSGTEVAHVYESAVRGFAARMTSARAAELAGDPDVAFVEPDPQLHVLGAPAGSVRDTDPVLDAQAGATWGLDRVDQRDLPLDGTYGYETGAANVTAYVIDTGIAAEHEEFGGRARTGYVASDRLTPGDCNGHGTHVAGTIGGATYGVAKEIELVAVQVADCQGSASGSDVLAGIDWVSRNATAPAVVNISMGGGLSPSLNTAVRNSVAKGITYAVAAGNEGTSACMTSPASAPEALTVGASDRDDRVADFSNYGSCLDLYAPGVSITSAWRTGGTATATGTSMATPHVTGAAALYLAGHPAAAPADVAAALTGRATPDRLTDVSSTSPNLLLYTGP